MKYEHHSDYTTADTELSEAGLLTVWAPLREFRDELVLIGGLVPRYLCKPQPGELQAVTMDVDLGICLGMSTGIYDTISTRLKNMGFEWKEGDGWKGKRFVKKIKNSNMFIDFLTDKPQPDAADHAMVDDIPVSAQPGIQRALDLCREVTICGYNLYDAEVKEKIRVCEVGPYVCLKLQAFNSRSASKDIFDVIRCVRDYDGGAEKAVQLFQQEKEVNPAYSTALCVLERDFISERSTGPMQYADFCLGKSTANSTLMTGLSGTMGTSGTDPMGDEIFLKKQRANEAFSVANLLLDRR